MLSRGDPPVMSGPSATSANRQIPAAGTSNCKLGVIIATLAQQYVPVSKKTSMDTDRDAELLDSPMKPDVDKVTAAFVNKVMYQLKDRPTLFKRFITYISQARAKETSNEKMLAHTEKMLAAYPQSVAAFRRFLNDIQAIYFGHVGTNQYAQAVSTIDPVRREAWNKLLDKIAHHFAGQQDRYREFCERLLGYGMNVKAIEARCKLCLDGAPHLYQELCQLIRKDIHWLHQLNPATSFSRTLARHFGSNSGQFLEIITAMSSGNSLGQPESLERVRVLLKDRPDLFEEYRIAINSPNFFWRQCPPGPSPAHACQSKQVAEAHKANATASTTPRAALSREQLLLLHEMHTAFKQDALNQDPTGKTPVAPGHKATMRQFFEVMQIEAQLQTQSQAAANMTVSAIQPRSHNHVQTDPSLSPLSATLQLAEEAAKNEKLPLPEFPAFASDIDDLRPKCGVMVNRHALLQQFGRLFREQKQQQQQTMKMAPVSTTQCLFVPTQHDSNGERSGKRPCMRPPAAIAGTLKQPSILFTLPPSAWKSPASLLYASTRPFGSPIQPPTLKAQSLRVPLRELAGRGYYNLSLNLQALYETDGEVESAMRWIREHQAGGSAPTTKSTASNNSTLMARSTMENVYRGDTCVQDTQSEATEKAVFNLHKFGLGI